MPASSAKAKSSRDHHALDTANPGLACREHLTLGSRIAEERAALRSSGCVSKPQSE